MLGQAHTPRRRLLPLAGLALAVLAAPAVGGASSSHSVSQLRARDASIASRSRAAVLGLYALDQRLAGTRAQLSALAGRARTLRAQRASLRLQLDVARRGLTRAERGLAQRVRDLYEQNDVSSIEVLYGSNSLDDAMTNLDDLSRASKESEQVLAELQLAKTRLASESRTLAREDAALAAATRSAAATASSLANTRAQQAAYVTSLAAERRLTQRAIAAVVSRAQAAQVRSQSITPIAHPPIPGGRTITVVATGYSLGGRTSTGLPTGYGVAAVDPSVIPLGTHMRVPGYGEAVAADTGGAVIGAVIDLWFPTPAQAKAWGRRTVAIVLH